MNIVKKKYGEWTNVINLDENYCIKCQDYRQLIKVLKFFEEHTDYVYDDTREHVSSNRSFNQDIMPTYIITNFLTETLYTTPVKPYENIKLTYSTAFLDQMNYKLEINWLNC